MNDMSLKAKIRNIASAKNVSVQSVLQNYLMIYFFYLKSDTGGTKDSMALISFG